MGPLAWSRRNSRLWVVRLLAQPSQEIPVPLSITSDETRIEGTVSFDRDPHRLKVQNVIGVVLLRDENLVMAHRDRRRLEGHTLSSDLPQSGSRDRPKPPAGVWRVHIGCMTYDLVVLELIEHFNDF